MGNVIYRAYLCAIQSAREVANHLQASDSAKSVKHTCFFLHTSVKFNTVLAIVQLSVHNPLHVSL